MSAAIGTIIVVALFLAVYVRRFRVITSKGYATRQLQTPDLARFSARSSDEHPGS
jgi:hypothetical protein